MTRTTGRLTALAVARAHKKPGMHADGDGLYLQVTQSGASWIYRFMLKGRAREMGLGPLALCSLQQARAKALEARRLRHEGIDPIEARRTVRTAAQLEVAKAVTFKECTVAYLKAHQAGWKNLKHRAQWESTIAAYAEPIIGALPVAAIDTALVTKVLEPIWAIKPETASRLRGRIESILDWAKARDFRQGENPARWRGHLDKLLSARAKVQKVRHHAALPFDKLGDFMVALQAQEGTAARALEFLILTAARTGEVIGARWSEINFGAKTWTIPAERMKAGKEHRVPLSPRAIAILEAMKPEAVEPLGYVFGGKSDMPLSNMAMSMVLRRMKRDNVTIHGFRSCFRDWAAETTNYPNHVVEMALAHSVGDKVEAAYRRGDLFTKRSRLMNEWAKFCAMRAAPAGKVVTLHRAS